MSHVFDMFINFYNAKIIMIFVIVKSNAKKIYKINNI